MKLTRAEKITLAIEHFEKGDLERLPDRKKNDLLLEVGRYKVINNKKYTIEIPKKMQKYIDEKIGRQWFLEVRRLYFGEERRIN